MDKLRPPPNSSPEEIEAWNAMMDTMVTFIKAATHLMNTITKKLRVPSAGPATEAEDPSQECEPECQACLPKLCQECRANAQPPKPAPPTQVTKRPISKVEAAAPQLRPESIAEEEVSEASADAEREAPAEEEEEEAPETEEAPAEEEEEGESPAEATENSEEPAPQKSPSEPATPADTPAGGDKECLCAIIRAKRQEDQCSCSVRKKKQQSTSEIILEEPEEEEVEQTCGCGSTPGNTEAMIQEMVEKLANSQREIAQLQEEMGRLQRMDASKRLGPHGGPNPAALYREIMKDTSGARAPQAQINPANVRRNLFNNSSPMNSTLRTPPNLLCLPCADSSGRSPSTPFGGSPDISPIPRPFMRPGARAESIPNENMGVGLPSADKIYPANVRRNLFNTSSPMTSTNNTNRTPPNPLCLPCADGSGRALFGGSPDISSIPRPLMRPGARAQSTPNQSIQGETLPPSFLSDTPNTSSLFPSSSEGQSPNYTAYSSGFEYTQNPNYWSRLPDYGSLEPRTEMIRCDSFRSPAQETSSAPPKRRVMCMPASRIPPGNFSM